MQKPPKALSAFIEVQLRELDAARLVDDPAAVAVDVVAFLETVPPVVRDSLLGLALALLDSSALVEHQESFAALGVARRKDLLLDLARSDASHALVSMLSSVGWLVIYSREPARRLVGFVVRPGTGTAIAEPARPPLESGDYDVCVVGSGAGGAVVASRLAAEGRRVLVLDAGRWISPSEFPTRDDHALMRLFSDGGVQPALPTIESLFKPGADPIVNVLQARVVGGGPLVNNAIHLPIEFDRWKNWKDAHDFGVDWAPLEAAMDRVRADLGVSSTEPHPAAGERSELFKAGAEATGRAVRALPVSVAGCLGCGGCNVGCRFDQKTGGPHGPVGGANEPRSYLMRALASGARVASRVRARYFRRHLLSGRVVDLVAEDGANDDRLVRVRAKRYVLAAGPLSSSRLLQRSAVRSPFEPNPVGRAVSMNLVTPVFAIMDRPFGGGSGRPDPGLQMCYYVDEGGGLLLETWFHYPGSLAVAVPGWLEEHVRVMRAYDRMAACGVVVPSGARGAVGPLGGVSMTVSGDEFSRLISGLLALADIFFAAGAVEVVPATRRPLRIRRTHKDADVALLRSAVRSPGDLGLATAHPQGGNALRRSRARGVVSKDFGVFGTENLFVADASLFPAGCRVNPQLTAMALAHLAAESVSRSLSS